MKPRLKWVPLLRMWVAVRPSNLLVLNRRAEVAVNARVDSAAVYAHRINILNKGHL